MSLLEDSQEQDYQEDEEEEEYTEEMEVDVRKDCYPYSEEFEPEMPPVAVHQCNVCNKIFMSYKGEKPWGKKNVRFC